MRITKGSTAGAATVVVAALLTACGSSAISRQATAPTDATAPVSSPAPASTSSAPSSAASAGYPASTSTSSATAHPATSALPSTAVSTSSGKAVIYGCDQQPVSQPKSFILLCGDGGAWLDDLVWSHWDAVTATATGVLLEKTCDPNCAAGGTTSSTATVTLTGLKDSRYTSLRVVSPKGVSDYRLDLMGPVTTG